MLNRWLVAAALSGAALAHAETTASDAWVRGTVAAQMASGAFLTLRSSGGGTLVSVATPVAERAEIHEMKMDGDVMRMRELTGGLTLPAGQAVTLAPGGVHVMLMGLKQPLRAGDEVPLTLVIEGVDKERETLQLNAPVRALGAMPAMKH